EDEARRQFAAGQPQPEVKDEQPRDEQGRFLAKEPTVEEPEADEPDETVFRYEIDLGDGSGKQVFEAPTQEELIEKLGQAQEHATRKIRQQDAALKAAQPKAEPAPATDNEDEWLLSQEVMSTPTAAVKKIFERIVGKPIEAFKNDLQRVEAFERGQREE